MGLASLLSAASSAGRKAASVSLIALPQATDRKRSSRAALPPWVRTASSLPLFSHGACRQSASAPCSLPHRGGWTM
jgi:hypothetical protein